MSNNPQKQLNMTRQGNTKSLEYFIEIGVYIALVCNFLILYGNSQGVSLFVSWPTRLMVSYIFLLAVVLSVNNLLSSRVGKIDAIFLLFALFMVASAYVSSGLFGMLGGLVSHMCFVMLPACLLLYRRVTNVSRIRKSVYIANFCYALLFVYLSRQSNSHYAFGEYGIEIVDELTLGYRNPNETGIYVMLSYLIMLTGFCDAKGRKKKIIYLAMLGILGYMLLQINSRTCVAITVVATVLVLLHRWVKLRSLLRWAILLLPAITALLLTLDPGMVEDMTFMGEAFDTGRYGLYQRFFQNQSLQTALFGTGVSANLHNSYMSVAYIYGFPLLILYIGLLNASLKEMQKRVDNTGRYAAFVGALAVVAHGIAEGTLLTAGAVYAGLAGLLFVLALPEEENK